MPLSFRFIEADAALMSPFGHPIEEATPGWKPAEEVGPASIGLV
jgi:hypothetical protein